MKSPNQSIVFSSQPFALIFGNEVHNWSVPPTFLALAKGTTNSVTGDGHFNLESTIVESTSTQTIESFVHDPKSLILKGKLDKYPYMFEARIIDTHVSFHVSIDGEASTQDRILIRFYSPPNEKIYGLGEQFSVLNLKGHRVPVLTREQGVGRGLEPLSTIINEMDPHACGDAWTTYTAVPYFTGSTNGSARGLLLETSAVTIFDFKSSLNTIEIEVLGCRKVSGRLFIALNYFCLCRQYTEFSGRMNKLPGWATDGVILGLQGGEKRVMDIVEQLLDNNVKISAVWLQDWCGQRLQKLSTMTLHRLWWNWESDSDRYPNWKQFVSQLKDRGIRVMSYINPMLTDSTTKPATRTNYFKKALDEKLFVMNSDRTGPELIESFAGLVAGQIDLTNPRACNFLKNIIKNEVLEGGVSGYMVGFLLPKADFGEYLSFSAKLYDEKLSALEYHNMYPHAWSELNRQVLKECNLEDQVVFFSRSAWYKTPGTSTLFWNGDQIPTFDKFDGMHSTIIAQISSGLCGFTLNHSDIGGYNALLSSKINLVRDKQVLWRWIELGLFGAVFRSHEGNIPPAHHQLYSEQDTMKFLARFSHLFCSLKIYRDRLMLQAQEFGYPLVRGLFMHFPTDSNCDEIDDQFMFGDALLVSPILERDQFFKKVYLPAGSKWTNLWTREIHAGGFKIEVEAGYGKIPVFLRDDLRNGLEDFIAALDVVSNIEMNVS